MRKTIFAALAICTAIGSTNALAVETGSAGYNDTRIKTYVFDPAQVYRITAHFGFVTTIQFARGEKVDSVQLGDHVSWQVDRLKRGDMLSVVPIDNGGAYTNMLVTTNQRVYSFEMTARHAPHVEDPSLTYLYRFDYPMTAEEFAQSRSRPSSIDDVVARNGEPGGDDLNMAYRASGPKRLKPVRMFDDGAKTYLAFAKGAPRPAAFAVAPDRSESVVNTSMLPDGTLVIHSVKPRFTLRGAGGVVCIYNDALLDDAEPEQSRRIASADYPSHREGK
jgi:type IV secretion system protein VirB9